jgi:hypothetical protein
MPRVHRSIPAALTALAALVALTVTGSPAQASTSVHISSAKTSAITVGTTHAQKFTVTVVATMPSGDSAMGFVAWTLQRFNGDCRLNLAGTIPVAKGTTYTGKSSVALKNLVSNDCAGSATLSITATDLNGGANDTYTHNVTIRRAARFVSLNASPEPVKKGHSVTVKATLQRASWADRHYHAFASQKARLQFAKTGGSFHTVKTVKASSHGALKTTAKQSSGGCWRYAFSATSTTAASVSSKDCVAVH